jgi:hypothetical protein
VVPRRFRWTLVAGEVALTFELLVGSVLVITALNELRGRDQGFMADGLIDANVALPPWRYTDATAREVAFEAMGDRIARIGGVERVVAAEGVPPGMGIMFGRVRVAGGERDAESTVFRGGFVGPGFVKTLGQPLRAGRDFEPGDGKLKPMPAIIGESTARRLFPDGEAVGKSFDLSDEGDFGLTVIGVVADIRIDGLADAADRPLLYAPMPEHHEQAHLLIRAARTDAAILAAIRSAILSVEDEAVVTSLAPMSDLMADTVARERFATTMMVNN